MRNAAEAIGFLRRNMVSCQQMKLADEFISYIRDVRRLSHNTVISYRTDLEEFSSFMQKAGLDERSFTKMDAADYARELAAEFSERSVLRKLTALRTYFGYLASIKEILTRHISGAAEEERRAAAAEVERAKAAAREAAPARSSDALIIDDDISKIQYKLARCCNPIKGDEVFGFVTIGSGITIHRTDCPNARRMRERYPHRVIEARWRSTAEGSFRASIRIVAADMTGMANHITEVISRDLKLNIRSMNFSAASGGCVEGVVSVEVPGAAVVDTLIHSIMRIKGVQRAYRINN